MESRKNYFREVISPYIKSKLEELKEKFGVDSWEYQSIVKQYEFNELEDQDKWDTNSKHYEANLGMDNVERLYKHHGCVEINFSCAAHCRYCLRSNYNGFVLTKPQIDKIVEYWKSEQLDEILITGGDPFLSPKILGYFCMELIDKVPTLRFIRIATRTFGQNPSLVNSDILSILKFIRDSGINVEVATQFGSPIELTWTETLEAIKKITDLGIKVYSQNVFLKGVNDTPEHLIDLYFNMRKANVEPHYLFNACPIKNTHHFRPSLTTMIECYERLVNSGAVTGRSKPILALMTSIGKITLTPFNVLEYKKGKYIVLKSRYTLKDRLAYNPNWKLPAEAFESEDGYLCIKYLDGED